MDRRNKRIEVSDRKNDNRIKDRGDLGMKKINDKLVKKNDENTHGDVKLPYPDRGDSECKITANQKPEKMRINIIVKKPIHEETKSKNVADGTDVASKKNYENGQDKAHSELELRKRIRDKYTLKLKNNLNKSDVTNSLNKKDVGKVQAITSDDCKTVTLDRPKKLLTEETTQTKEKQKLSLSPPSSGTTERNEKREEEKRRSERSSAKYERTLNPIPEKNKQERKEIKRKPMIKTIMTKNGSMRIYKAVTFVDQRKSPTPLEISIPGDGVKKQKVSKYTDTSSLKLKTRATVSRVSIKEKPVTVRKKDKKRERKSRHVPSPDCSVRDLNRSPPTEVARWAPACIDQHTKPYYEAWVNTTLAAISKSSKKDKLFYEKQREQILLSFQKALEERPTTPELVYENFADERYTGRIKITQR